MMKSNMFMICFMIADGRFSVIKEKHRIEKLHSRRTCFSSASTCLVWFRKSALVRYVFLNCLDYNA